MDDERLTEAEWTRRDAERECSRHGHDWQILSTMRGPFALNCERNCGHPGYRTVLNDTCPTSPGDGDTA